MFTQAVKNRLVAQAEQQVREAQAAVTFARNLPVGSATEIARATRLNTMNGIHEVQPKRRGRRHLSAKAKAHISKMMKKRWKERKAQKA